MYLDTVEALDQWLLTEGLDEIELFTLSQGKLGKKIEIAQLKQALKWLTELENLLRKLTRKGLGLQDYLAFKAKEKLPLFRIDEDAGPRYIYTEKEWKKFKTDYLSERKEKLKQEMKAGGEEVAEVGEAAEEFGPEGKDLWELAKIDAPVEKLKTARFAMRSQAGK